ncbi:MAG: hypothetical protein ABJA71_10695 [Ginsengibacter sp.]
MFLMIGEINSADISLNGIERSSTQLHLLFSPWLVEFEDSG